MGATLDCRKRQGWVYKPAIRHRNPIRKRGDRLDRLGPEWSSVWVLLAFALLLWIQAATVIEPSLDDTEWVRPEWNQSDGNQSTLEGSLMAGDFRNRSTEIQIQAARKEISSSMRGRVREVSKSLDGSRQFYPRNHIGDSGTVELFSYRSMRYCRLHAVCRSRSGDLLLPSWMERFQEDITACMLFNSIFRPRKILYLKEIESEEIFEGGFASSLDWLLVDIPADMISEIARESLSSISSYRCRNKGGPCGGYRGVAINPATFDGDIQRSLRPFAAAIAKRFPFAVDPNRERWCFRSAIVAKERDFEAIMPRGFLEASLSGDHDHLMDLLDDIIHEERRHILSFRRRTYSRAAKSYLAGGPAQKLDSDRQVRLGNSDGALFIFRQVANSNQVFCRLTTGLLSNDGTLYLPVWMRSHIRILLSCGFQSVSFDVPPENMVIDSPQLTSFDLVGMNPARLTMNSMSLVRSGYLIAFLSQMTHNVDLKNHFSYDCLSNLSVYCRNVSMTMDLRPAVRVLSRNHLKEVENSFIALMRSVIQSKDSNVVITTNSSNNSYSAFRSVYSFGSDFNVPSLYHVGKRQDPERESCPLDVRIIDLELNGADSHHSFLNLRRAIHFKTKTRYFSSVRNLSATVGSLSLRRRESDISTDLRMTNVLIMSSGNWHQDRYLIHLQKGSLVIELVPFGTEQNETRALAALLSIRLVQVQARPDRERYFSCLGNANILGSSKKHTNAFASDENNSSLKPTKILTRASAAMEEEWKWISVNSESDELHVQCLHRQRLLLMPEDVAGIALREASRKCLKI